MQSNNITSIKAKITDSNKLQIKQSIKIQKGVGWSLNIAIWKIQYLLDSMIKLALIYDLIWQ